MIKFIIPVKPATKKNSGQIITVKGRPILIPSKIYQEFEKSCLPYLNHVKAETGVINYPVNVACEFYMESRRRVDLANLLNAVDDAMVKAKLVLDDNRDIIAAHDGSRVFYDKFNPRIEVTITKMEPEYFQWNDTQTEQRTLGL